MECIDLELKMELWRVYIAGTNFNHGSEFLCSDDVADKKISLRATPKALSRFHGQGFQRRNCKTKCVTNKCRCKGLNVLCNSKCFGSTSSCNK